MAEITDLTQSDGKKYDLGLALSGGSIKGFAHIGVLKYLEEQGANFGIVSGTSAGSLVAALYADGFHPEEIFEILSKLSFRSMASLTKVKGGLFSIDNLKKLLKKNLRHKNIEDLEKELRIVATDIDEGKRKVFDSGDIADIVLASCSIPVLFQPHQINGVNYVDGGLFKNFPVSIIREKANHVIGVNLVDDSDKKDNKNIIGIAIRSWNIIFKQNSLYDRKICDTLIEMSDFSRYGMFDVDEAPSIMQIGYERAKEILENKKLNGI